MFNQINKWICYYHHKALIYPPIQQNSYKKISIRLIRASFLSCIVDLPPFHSLAERKKAMPNKIYYTHANQNLAFIFDRRRKRKNFRHLQEINIRCPCQMKALPCGTKRKKKRERERARLKKKIIIGILHLRVEEADQRRKL